MTTTKLTKVEKFNMVLAILNDVETENKEMLLDFLNHEIELLKRKKTGSDKAIAKKNAETERLKNELLNALAEYGKPTTVTDFHDNSPAIVATLSVSKLTSLLTLLKNDGKVVRTEIKKRPFYSVATIIETGE